jgi:hypothetical protein
MRVDPKACLGNGVPSVDVKQAPASKAVQCHRCISAFMFMTSMSSIPDKKFVGHKKRDFIFGAPRKRQEIRRVDRYVDSRLLRFQRSSLFRKTTKVNNNITHQQPHHTHHHSVVALQKLQYNRKKSWRLFFVNRSGSFSKAVARHAAPLSHFPARYAVARLNS